MSPRAGGHTDLLTAQGVERAGLWVMVGTRAVNVAQMSIGLAGTLSAARRPWLDVSLAAVFLLSGSLVVVVGLRQHRIPGRWLLVDVVTGVGILLLTPAFIAPEHVTSWAAWPYAVTLLTASLAAAAVGLRTAAICTLVLAGSYCTWLRLDLGVEASATILSNALAYPLFACVLHFVLRYLRRLAGLADERYAQVRTLERERTRRTLHAPYRLLHALSSLVREAHSGNEQARWLLAEASASAREIEDLVRGAEPTETNLGTALASLSEQFTDLPVQWELSGLRGAFEPELTARVREAARSALQNVRHHARAESVIVYARGHPGDWLVSVFDDGVGFDTATVAGNTGLRSLVVDAITEVGGHVTLTSSPGEGTLVEIIGGARALR